MGHPAPKHYLENMEKNIMFISRSPQKSGVIEYPEFKFIETNNKFGPKSSIGYNIYQIDWSACHKRWFKYGYDVPPLPLEYIDQVTNLEFALNDSYRRQINVSFMSAQQVWSINYPFDTMIREICYEPAVAHIWVGFRLLADCIYNRDENYFCRSDGNQIAQYLMPYLFWFGQTGYGLLEDHSHLDRLRDNLKYHLSLGSIKQSFCKEYLEVVQTFFEKFDPQMEKIKEAHAKKYSVKGSASVQPGEMTVESVYKPESQLEDIYILVSENK